MADSDVFISGKLFNIPLNVRKDGLELIVQFMNGSIVVLLACLPATFFISVQHAQYLLPLLLPLQSHFMVNAVGAGVLALAFCPAAISTIAFIMLALMFLNCSAFWIKCIW
jgi:hypothetical protein